MSKSSWRYETLCKFFLLNSERINYNTYICTIEIEKNIVFYDGECGFCNRAVSFILIKDRTTSLCFASIQSEFAQNFFTSKHWDEPDLSTFYFYENGVLYEKSTGALRLLNYFSRSYKLLKVFWLVPVGIRDWIYNAVAKRRERLSNGYCILPTADQRERFLD